AAGAVFGPIGALVGSVAGYMIASGVYQSCLAILKKAPLAEAEALRVMQLCDEAAEEIRRQHEALEYMIKQQLEYNESQYAACFALIDRGMRGGQFADTVLALERFNGLFSNQLKLAKFDEFD